MPSSSWLGELFLFSNSESANPRPGFDHWVSFHGQGRYFGQNFNVNGRRVKQTGYITDRLTEYALDWLQNRNGDQPFCLFLSHKAPHYPWHPAPRHKNRYANAPINWPETLNETKDGVDNKPEWVADQRNSPLGVGGKSNLEKMYRHYCGTLRSLDDSIGAILTALNRNDDADSTLMMYMSDNGLLLGEHGLIDKRVAYEPSIRIPVLAYAPELIKSGTKVNELISNVDIAPTMLDLAGQSAPDTMFGQSIAKLLTKNKINDWRKTLLYEYFWSPRFPRPPTEFALRSENDKYILSYGRPDLNEFYNLKQDPQEQRNRINDNRAQNRISKMKNQLYNRLQETESMLVPVQR